MLVVLSGEDTKEEQREKIEENVCFLLEQLQKKQHKKTNTFKHLMLSPLNILKSFRNSSSHTLSCCTVRALAGLCIFLHMQDNWLFSPLTQSPWGVILFQKHLNWLKHANFFNKHKYNVFSVVIIHGLFIPEPSDRLDFIRGKMITNFNSLSGNFSKQLFLWFTW